MTQINWSSLGSAIIFKTQRVPETKKFKRLWLRWLSRCFTFPVYDSKATALFTTFGISCLHYYLVQNIFYFSLWLLYCVLFKTTLLNFPKIRKRFPVIFLLLISGSILLWSWNIFSMISVLGNLLTPALWLNTHSEKKNTHTYTFCFKKCFVCTCKEYVSYRYLVWCSLHAKQVKFVNCGF